MCLGLKMEYNKLIFQNGGLPVIPKLAYFIILNRILYLLLHSSIVYWILGSIYES